MVKIANSKIDHFVKSPDKFIKSVLLYGPDVGLVSIRAKDLMSSIVPDVNDYFNRVDINYNDIKDNLSVFYDEISSISLLGGRKVIKLRDMPTKPINEIVDFIKCYDGDNFIVCTSSDIKPTSILRKTFEKEKHLASIPCYKDDSNSIKNIIRETLRKENYKFDNQLVEYLSLNFSGDRMVIINELEKLITYVGKDVNKIEIDDVVKSIGNANEVSIENLYYAVASQNSSLIDKNLNLALQESVPAIMIIRSCLNYFVKLHSIKSESMATNISIEKVISSIRPPVFFKQVPILRTHLSKWRIESINKIISSLIDLEKECKSSTYSDELILKRFLTIVPIAIKNP